MSDTDPYMAIGPNVEEARYPATAEPTPAPEPEVTDAPVIEEMTVPEGSVKEVLAWVGDDADKAKAALDAETKGEKRKTLITKLEELV